jgi:hypothetical protein
MRALSPKPLLGMIVVIVLVGIMTIPAEAGAKKDVRAAGLKLTATELSSSISDFAEPFIALTAKDHVLICGPTGDGAGIIRSPDWVTFTRSQVNHTGGGGDCDLAVGPDRSVYVSDLQLFASAISKSIDDGQTFDYQTSEDPVEQDREWLAADPKDGSIVYLAYHDVVAESEIVAKSTDGGRTFVQHSVVSNDPELAPDTYPNTFSGPLRIDPTNHNRLYLTYAISTAGTNANECQVNPTNCPFGAPENIIVARSDDGGLTWTDHVAMQGPPGSVVGNLFPSLSVDLAGNIYAAAAGHLPDANGNQVNGIFYTVSTDRGVTWSDPIKVNTGDGAVVFPAVVAGVSGVVDFSWIQSTSPDNHDTSGDWTVRFAQTRNGLATAPSFNRATGPIVHHGEVCVTGITCAFGGDRSLLDFMGLALDSFGYAHMTVASNATGGPHVLYWRQDAGGSAYTAPCSKIGPQCVYKRPGPTP